MMLSVAALSAPAFSMASAVIASSPMAAAACATVAAIFSPSQHPFMKRAAEPNHFSFDPYKTVRAQYSDLSSSECNSKPLSSVSSFIVSSPDTKRAAAAAVVAAPVVAAPAAAPALSYRIVSVAFKQGSALFRAPFRLCEGDAVIVDGDRGEHIGTVKAVKSAVESEAIVADPTANVVKGRVIRRATAGDLEALAAKAAKEAAAIADVAKIAKDVRLNATIADVEYQFDNNKLTIYVERATSTTFVDFRKVQRTLFKMFHCRIWFVYMDELVQ